MTVTEHVGCLLTRLSSAIDSHWSEPSKETRRAQLDEKKKTKKRKEKGERATACLAPTPSIWTSSSDFTLRGDKRTRIPTVGEPRRAMLAMHNTTPCERGYKNRRRGVVCQIKPGHHDGLGSSIWSSSACSCGRALRNRGRHLQQTGRGRAHRRLDSCSPAAPRAEQMESISSMKIVEGAWNRAISNRICSARRNVSTIQR